MATDLDRLFSTAAAAASAFRDSVGALSAAPEAGFDEILARFETPVPEQGTKPEAVLSELLEKASDGLMKSTHPRFFGWVIGASHPAGVAADFMVSAWGQNAAFHSPTPAAAAIEQVAEGWLLDLLDLPRTASVGFVTCATVANAVALSAARSRVLANVGWDVEADGLFGAPPVRVLIGEDAHSSLFSSLQMIGFGARRVETLATDAQGRIKPAALEAALKAGEGPMVLILGAGQINTGDFDPFADLIPQAKAKGAWVHVDGAFGLWARATPTHWHLTEGVEQADSWATDGHKYLQVPYDCGFAIVADRAAHLKAMTQWASYLPTMSGGERVPSAFVPELSRRARGIPVWATIKALGRDGIADLVSRTATLSQRMAARLAAEPGISVLNTVVLNQVSVAFGTGNEARALTEQVIAAVQAEGTCFAGGSLWHDRWVMRISVSSQLTRAADIDRSADAIIAAWRAVQRG
jgi:glutamate/tyrosine decarboxylase-like PLP-dependent enzyme